MSCFTFIASNKPLKEIKNNNIQPLSINEARKRGICLNEKVLEGIDPDKKGVIIFCNSEEDTNELEITKKMYYNAILCKMYSNKKYFSQISFAYNDERANKLIEYINDHLKKSSDIELWSIWVNDDYSNPTIYNRTLRDLSINDIKNIYGKDYYDKPECIVVRKD